MLRERGVEHEYREYTEAPLSKAELQKVFKMLGVRPKELLRRNDKAYKELELDGDESDAKLLKLMAAHPTLLQRPIAVLNGRAVVGRPADAILSLLD